MAQAVDMAAAKVTSEMANKTHEEAMAHANKVGTCHDCVKLSYQADM